MLLLVLAQLVQLLDRFDMLQALFIKFTNHFLQDFIGNINHIPLTLGLDLLLNCLQLLPLIMVDLHHEVQCRLQFLQVPLFLPMPMVHLQETFLELLSQQWLVSVNAEVVLVLAQAQGSFLLGELLLGLSWLGLGSQ